MSACGGRCNTQHLPQRGGRDENDAGGRNTPGILDQEESTRDIGIRRRPLSLPYERRSRGIQLLGNPPAPPIA